VEKKGKHERRRVKTVRKRVKREKAKQEREENNHLEII